MPARAHGIRNLAGGGNVSSGAPGSARNAAGAIGYCAENNYPGSDAAASMKDDLIGKTGIGSAHEHEDFGRRRESHCQGQGRQKTRTSPDATAAARWAASAT
ncbi:MAG: hypothetical protein ABI846_06365 [Rudaea sp.]